MTTQYAPNLDQIIDVAVSHGMPPMIMFVQWNFIAEAQMKVLLEQGLQPNHKLLDFGCGMGRLAINAIQFLNENNYAGIDADERYLKICRDLIAPINKSAKLHLNGTFDFAFFNMQFEYGMAQSVFTHLSDQQVRDCVSALTQVMAPGGKFIFSYIPTNFPIGLVYEGEYPLLHPANQTTDFFRELAHSNNIHFEEIATAHPTQKWAKFTF